MKSLLIISLKYKINNDKIPVINNKIPISNLNI